MNPPVDRVLCAGQRFSVFWLNVINSLWAQDRKPPASTMNGFTLRPQRCLGLCLVTGYIRRVSMQRGPGLGEGCPC